MTVKAGGQTLILDKDFTVSYQNNLNIGTAQVVITGNGGFTGTKSVKFKIKE